MGYNIDRRGFLRAGALLAAAAAAGGVGLGACAAAPAGAPVAAATGEPRRGGTLRAAFVGAGAAETLNYFVGPTGADFVRARAMHGALGALDPAQPDGVRYTVLEGIDVADDLSTYTLRVRPGVTFTDGSPLTAADVLFSLNAPVTFEALPYLLTVSRNFDLAAATTTDDLTLVLPTARPIADGRLLLCQSTLVIKDGTTGFTPEMATCGPFRLTSFEPGRGSVLVRHDGFGEAPDGGPYLDELELLSIAAADARSAALTGGQVDFVHDLGPVVGRTLSADGTVVVAPSELPAATFLGFDMNVTYPPFADNRVRTAFKLAVDRQAIVDTVLFGQGFVGNDLAGLGFPDYADDIEQRAYDPDRAMALLREAGAEGMSVVLTTGPEIPGMVETATLLVEDLAAIGVNATLEELPAGQLFAASPEERAQRQMSTSYAPPVPALSSYENTTGGRTATAFGVERPDLDALVAQARGGMAEAGSAAQRIIWEEGNRMIPVYLPTVNAQVPAVSGMTTDPFPNLTGVWLA